MQVDRIDASIVDVVDSCDPTPTASSMNEVTTRARVSGSIDILFQFLHCVSNRSQTDTSDVEIVECCFQERTENGTRLISIVRAES
jgi:hypothetical protein